MSTTPVKAAVVLLLELRIDDVQDQLDSLPPPTGNAILDDRAERLRWRYRNQIGRLNDVLAEIEVSTWSKEQ